MFQKSTNDDAVQISRPQNNEYTLYGWERSYFTRKLEAALHFYNAAYHFKRVTKENQQEIRLRAATHQIPVLHTPENWMIADTTPLMVMLDHRFAGRHMFPGGPLGVLTHCLEEYFDEWIARTSVHWRWSYPENHQLLAMDASDGQAADAAALMDWGQRVCRATGVSSEQQKQAAEDEYHRIMAAAEKQLSETDYLLGDRPTALDCIFLGGLRAHFNFDPAPRKVIHDAYPITIKWCEELADQWDGSGELEPFPDSTPFAQFILGEMAQTYQKFALGNKQALANGDKAFVLRMYDEDVSYLARPYIEQSRQMIVHRIQRLDSNEKKAIENWLRETGLTEVFS